MKAVFRAEDGRGAKTVLTDIYLEHMDYDHVMDMRDDFLDNPQKEYDLSVVPELLRAAAVGDKVAAAIINRQGEELGVSACAVIRGLKLEQTVFDVVLAGSVIVKEPQEQMFRIIKNKVNAVAPNARIQKLEEPPVMGAILRAMDEYKLSVSELIWENLRKTTNI